MLSAIANTARVEKIFLTFSLVQSKLHNRFGNEKAEKLTFVYMYLNSNTNSKNNQDINWIWDEEPIPIQETETEEYNDD